MPQKRITKLFLLIYVLSFMVYPVQAEELVTVPAETPVVEEQPVPVEAPPAVVETVAPAAETTIQVPAEAAPAVPENQGEQVLSTPLPAENPELVNKAEEPKKEQPLISLNFQNTDISLVLNFFSEVTGLTFILGDNVRGSVTVISNKRIPVDEALDMLQSILEIKGFAMVRYENVVKIVTQSEALQKSIEIRTSETGGGDRVVTQIIPLKCIDANEVRNSLQPLISRNGNIMADDRTNALILTDVVSNIKKIMKVLEQIDVQVYGDRIKVEIISLKYTEENALASKIKTILMSTKPRLVNFLEIIPDTRLHALVVITTQGNMAVVKDLAIKLDRETPKANDNTQVFFLQNSKAGDISKILTEMMKPGAAASIDGGMSVVTDERTNALIITTSNQNYPRIQRIIEKLDVRTPQVLIKVLLAEVSLTKENKMGIEWSYSQGWGKNNPQMSGKATQSFGVANYIGDGLKYAVLKEDGTFSALLQALATDQKVNILSTPHVLASNNQQAMIKVGEEIPILRDVRYVKTDASTTGEIIKTYDYKPVAIELTVTPRINTERDVALDVQLIIKKILGTNAELNAPILASREAKTSVVVKDGQTVVIGGLIKDDDSSSDSKIPLISDIPIIGWLFKKQGQTKEKTELMVFITPYVVLNATDADNLTKAEEAKVSIKATPNKISAKQQYDQALAEYRNKNYQNAIEQWKKVLEMSPDTALAKKAAKYIKKAEGRMKAK